MSLTFERLRERNSVRNEEFLARIEIDDTWNIVDRSNELAGEAGELANLCKKLRRHKLGMTEEDVYGIIKDIQDEVADIIITVDLLAMDLDISLEKEVPRKFNESSDKFGLSTKFKTECDCGNLINCVCHIKEVHEKKCNYRRAACFPFELACEHGFQACSMCDPCTCSAEIPQEELEDLR